MRAGKGGERYHLAAVTLHVPLVEIVRQHAVRRIGLHIDLFHPTAIDKVINVGAAPGGRQRLVDVVNRNPQRLGLGLIDINLELRRVLQAIRTNFGCHVRVFGGHKQQLVTCLG
ncbi:hypothetical protein D3C75_993260 [compost metagenome]